MLKRKTDVSLLYYFIVTASEVVSSTSVFYWLM